MSLCQAQKCVKIEQNRIGKGKETPTCKIASDEVINDEKFQIEQVQVTDVMLKQQWSWKKPLTVEITEKKETSVLNLPEPLIYLKKANITSFFENIVISPKENLQRYGNLLGRNRLGKCRDVCSSVNNIRNCEVMCFGDRTKGTYVKVYVGVVMARPAPSGMHFFNLCQDGDCVKGGSASTFGAGDWPKLQPGEVVDDEKFKILEVDVSDVLRDQGWSFFKPLEAKMTTNLIKNLPEPVVVIKTYGKGGKLVESKLIFNSNEKRERYGNLLDKYSKIKADRI